MENIIYVTGNYAKYLNVKTKFDKNSLALDYFEHDFIEPNINDIEYISKYKVMEVYNILKRPCFVADAGFYIDDYPNEPGFPGAFVKRAVVSNGIEKLLYTMKNVSNRNCKFVDCLTFYDGNEFYTFYGTSCGTLATSKKGSDRKESLSSLWYVFIPRNCNKTLAEMTEEERLNRNDDHTSATLNFIDWYKNEYSKENVKRIKKTL
jgi:XTP/dITP diphosphohydrolase